MHYTAYIIQHTKYLQEIVINQHEILNHSLLFIVLHASSTSSTVTTQYFEYYSV